jgi:glycosyltransferase involved in cell wall biosynthesis
MLKIIAGFILAAILFIVPTVEAKVLPQAGKATVKQTAFKSNGSTIGVSVKKFADEIIVVDMKSDDTTQKVAKKNGAEVYEFKRVGYVEPARNFAISKAKGEWILILDADEEIPQSLAKHLQTLVESDGSVNYYRLPRQNIVFGKALKYSRWWPDYNIRFFKKGTVVWDDEIHSIPITSGKGADIEANEDYAIVHHHYETVEQYIDRMISKFSLVLFDFNKSEITPDKQKLSIYTVACLVSKQLQSEI